MERAVGKNNIKYATKVGCAVSICKTLDALLACWRNPLCVHFNLPYDLTFYDLNANLSGTGPGAFKFKFAGLLGNFKLCLTWLENQ